MSPNLVRLPGAALTRRDWLLSTIHRQAPKTGVFFRLAPDELRFARALADRRSNMWIYRCHQQRACADFVLVDMSAPDPARRSAWVVEVKLGRPVRPGVGQQFLGAGRAVADLTACGVLHAGARARCLLGGTPALLRHFSAG